MSIDSSGENAKISVVYVSTNATRYSQSDFTGIVNTNPFTFEARDGFNNTNSFTLEFEDGKIYLSGSCVQSDGFWCIPEMNRIEMKKG